MSAKLLAPRPALCAALLFSLSCSSSRQGAPSDSVPARPTFTLFALAETRGQIGPCGCTTDPLGDLSRTAAMISQARQEGPVLVVDAGGLLYAQTQIGESFAAQEELKANLLVSTYRDTLGVAAIGLGANDLAKGPSSVRPARAAVNLPTTGDGAKIPIEAPKVVELGGTKVGVFGVIAEGAIPTVAVTEPVAAGKAAVAELAKQGAQVVVALVAAPTEAAATRLAAAIGGIDFAVAGLGQSAPEPDRVETVADRIPGGGFLVTPGNRGQVVSRIEVTLRKGGGMADAGGRAAADVRIAQIDARVPAVEAEVARLSADASAEQSFVLAKKNELAGLQAERARLERSPLTPPAKGSFFTLEQVRIAKKLACHLGVQQQTAEYFKASGEANVRFAKSQPASPIPAGAPTYVGSAKCVECHDTAVDFWKKTRHAKAWNTLVERGQQFDLECTSCHVTGWNKPGGASLAKVEGLEDVQCEVCHGPASIHVAKEGEDEPKTLVGGPEPTMCAKLCHTKEHSDTFNYDAYLRDIVGPGHGEERRKALGDGPTGHELRTAGLARAGKELGAGCTK